jgi:hypothetical protein
VQLGKTKTFLRKVKKKIKEDGVGVVGVGVVFIFCLLSVVGLFFVGVGLLVVVRNDDDATPQKK